MMAAQPLQAVEPRRWYNRLGVLWLRRLGLGCSWNIVCCEDRVGISPACSAQRQCTAWTCWYSRRAALRSTRIPPSCGWPCGRSSWCCRLCCNPEIKVKSRQEYSYTLMSQSLKTVKPSPRRETITSKRNLQEKRRLRTIVH